MEAIAIALKETIKDTVPKLEAMNRRTVATRPFAGQWSTKEIVGHLIDSAANNHQRFVRVLQAGELNFPPYAQEEWVCLQQYNSANWVELIALWRAFNLHLVHLIGQIAAHQLEYLCTIGPDNPVTLGFLIEDYMAHLKLHLKQIGL